MLTDDAKDCLVKTGFDPSFGARPLKHVIQHEVENPLSKKIRASSKKATKSKSTSVPKA